jgi:tRNA-dihydrouridine synthase
MKLPKVVGLLLLLSCCILEFISALQLQQFHIAPMQGYTNSSLRRLFNLLSPSSIKWTEMEKLDDIYPKTQTQQAQYQTSESYLLDALEKRIGSSSTDYDNNNNNNNNNNLILQLGSNDPGRLQSCVRHTVQHYNNNIIREINLNCGCPAIDSGGSTTYGASLMKDASLTGKLVQSVREGLILGGGQLNDVGISVKCRIAVFDHESEQHYPLDETDYDYLKKYISTIYNAGANHIILHARPAILSGLSPVKNRIVPKLDYNFVERIASDFSQDDNINFTLNGGITSLSQLQSLIERNHDNSNKSPISSYMAGRWCLQRPLDLIGIEELLSSSSISSSSSRSSCSTSSLFLIRTAIEQYVDDTVRIGCSSSLKYKPTIAELCLPLFLIVEQLKDDYDYEYYDDDDEGNNIDEFYPIFLPTTKQRQEKPMLTYDEIESLYEVLVDGLDQIIEELSPKNNNRKIKKKKDNNDINFKRLSSTFKSLVGTKVVNKWKRNRAEL